MSGGFKRSGRFGLIGVFVVAALVAAIASTTGQGEANPKITLGLIFAVIAVFVVVLLILQRADLERAAGGDAKATERAAAQVGSAADNPTTLSEADLWAALAVDPITPAAVKARAAGWEAGRRSLELGAVIFALILLTVPAIYLLESFVPLLIGGPLIVVAALYGSFRAVGPGGEMDQGYRRVGEAMAPLGLTVSERPTVSIEMRDPVTPRMGPEVHGLLELSGERHGRRVVVQLGSGETGARSEIRVGGPVPAFEAKSRDGRVRASEDAPAGIAAALGAVPNSTRWKKLAISGGPDGVVVTRKGGGQGDWLCDLWLAERLAAA
ncbi:MAG: hypothetical protein ABW065_13200 [Solirubrobacterales bacterium]